MDIKILNIDKVQHDFKEIKELYEESFPKTERFPFEYIVKQAKKKDIEFEVAYDNEKVIGISYTIFENNFAFILYFAVNTHHRGKGYGTKLLNYLKEKYKNYTILLEIEEITQNSANYEQRIRRKSFYEKNGFFRTNVLIKEVSNIFEIMTNDININFNNKLFRKIYKKMFNGLGKLLVPIFVKLK